MVMAKKRQHRVGFATMDEGLPENEAMDVDMLADAAIALLRRLERRCLADEETLRTMLNLKDVLRLCGYDP